MKQRAAHLPDHHKHRALVRVMDIILLALHRLQLFLHNSLLLGRETTVAALNVRSVMYRIEIDKHDQNAVGRMTHTGQTAAIVNQL